MLVTYRGGHHVIEEALERAGAARRIALRVPHFTVVPMVLERSDLILTLPARVARVYERRGNLKARPLPIPIPPAEVAVHWHERFEADPGNRWLRGLIVGAVRRLGAVREDRDAQRLGLAVVGRVAVGRTGGDRGEHVHLGAQLDVVALHRRRRPDGEGAVRVQVDVHEHVEDVHDVVAGKAVRRQRLGQVFLARAMVASPSRIA